MVTAKRLGEARTSIQTQIGASTYTITASDIENAPGGDNTLLNQVILQMPDVAQDSFGQFHIRGEHNALQYRLNGIILPEGISVFGQTLDPRLASSVELITGALPAEYGLVTGGIVDMKTKSGLFEPGGEVSMYGGSHSELQPSFDYGGSIGTLQLFRLGRLSDQSARHRIARRQRQSASRPHASNITASPIWRTFSTITAASAQFSAPRTTISRFPISPASSRRSD